MPTSNINGLIFSVNIDRIIPNINVFLILDGFHIHFCVCGIFLFLVFLISSPTVPITSSGQFCSEMFHPKCLIMVVITFPLCKLTLSNVSSSEVDVYGKFASMSNLLPPSSSVHTFAFLELFFIKANARDLFILKNGC